MSFWTRVTGIVLVALSVAGFAPGADGLETVTIRGQLTHGPVELRHGFLHGVDVGGTLDSTLVAALRPAHWRVSKDPAFSTAIVHGAAVTYNLSDSYAWSQGGYPNAKPWLHWAVYEAAVRAELEIVRDFHPPDAVEYWDIWNEPDHPFFWTGTFAQFVETFARGHAVVQDVFPGAKVVGPNISRYVPGAGGVAGIIDFLVALEDDHGIRIDAVAWHENDDGWVGGDFPEDIPVHAASIRSAIAASFPPDYDPELHVNEYAGTRVHLSPGWNVGYLAGFEQGGIDGWMRAGWTVQNAIGTIYQDVWAGLDGALSKNGRTQTHNYWVLEAYARHEGQTRVDASGPTRTPVLAARDDVEETMSLLLGRYAGSASSDVRLAFVGYPFDHASVRVTASRIPHLPGFYEPIPTVIKFPDGPLPEFQMDVPVVSGAFQVTVPAVAEGEAWIVEVVDSTPTGVAGPPGAKRVSGLALAGSNPMRGEAHLRLTTARAGPVRLDVLDAAGRRVVNLLSGTWPGGTRTVTWDGRDVGGHPVASGVYFARSTSPRSTHVVRLVLVR